MRALPVFFGPEMVGPRDPHSPSAEKPAQVVASWQRLGIPLEVRPPVPVTRVQLALAHDPTFVTDVLSCRIENGFGNRSSRVAATLPFTTGAMLSAAREALANGGAAVAPCSGFHHATYRQTAGFCTFNGLMVTAAVLQSEGVGRVGIFDCDHHEGDGTDEIIARLGAADRVHHVTVGARWSRPRQVPDFFERLPSLVEGFAGCEVVLYQAGADPHIDDPLGGWLTTEELRERDARVFEGLHALRVPVAWNLAGGYQRDRDGGIPEVLAIHDNTLRECARVHLGVARGGRATRR